MIMLSANIYIQKSSECLLDCTVINRFFELAHFKAVLKSFDFIVDYATYFDRVKSTLYMFYNICTELSHYFALEL